MQGRSPAILPAPRRDYFLLFFLWLILTAVNINKAFHIDDPFHLEAAQRISETPLKPMSGLINWADDPSPMHLYNQPSLFFYSVAGVGALFGYHEIPMHLFLSVFTFLALYFFYKICRFIRVQRVGLLLALFAFCPAFIINQNLMTDTPILALMLGFTWFLLKANDTSHLKNYSYSALLLGCGLLIKYSLLPLLVALFLVIALRKHYKYLVVLLIPLLLLCGWSLWNYAEYGSVHILDRPRGNMDFGQLFAFMGCLGCVSLVSLSFISGLLPYRMVPWLCGLALLAALVFVIRAALCPIPEGEVAEQLNNAFIINGFFICGLLVLVVIMSLVKTGLRQFVTGYTFTFLLLGGTVAVFIVLFAPFMATRHVLLIIPFVLLLMHPLTDRANSLVNSLTLGATALLGLLLGVSDWQYAHYYRQLAAEVALPKNKTVWAPGHWGWQWYSQQRGMLPYFTYHSLVKTGDYFVYPKTICLPQINSNITLTVMDKKWHEAGPLSFFSGSNYATLYNSFNDKAPWILSKRPIDTLLICVASVKTPEN